MFEYDTWTYREEAHYLYTQRRKKYTITNEEKSVLISLINSVDILSNKTYSLTDLKKSPYIKVKDKHFNLDEDNGYKILMEKIKKMIELTERYNNEIDENGGFKKYFSYFFKINDNNLRVALEFVKYHHYNFMALQNPQLTYTQAKGVKSDLKKYEKNQDATLLNPPPSNEFSYSAKNIYSHLTEKTKSFLFFTYGPVKQLATLFKSKITDAKDNIRTLNIKQNKKTLLQEIQAGFKPIFLTGGSSSAMMTHHEMIDRNRNISNDENYLSLFSDNDRLIQIPNKDQRNNFVSICQNKIDSLKELIKTDFGNDANYQIKIDLNATRAMALNYSKTMKSTSDTLKRFSAEDRAKMTPSPFKVRLQLYRTPPHSPNFLSPASSPNLSPRDRNENHSSTSEQTPSQQSHAQPRVLFTSV